MHLRRLFNYLKRPAHSPHLNDDFPISSFVCTFLSALPSRDHAERATEPMYVSFNRLNADPPLSFRSLNLCPLKLTHATPLHYIRQSWAVTLAAEYITAQHPMLTSGPMSYPLW